MNAFVYIAKDLRGVLHTDVTLSLNRTMWQHRFGDDQDALQQPVFESLIFIERHSNLASAYRRRAELRRMQQADLETLARRRNPGLKDLSSLWFSPRLACIQVEEAPSEAERP